MKVHIPRKWLTLASGFLLVATSIHTRPALAVDPLTMFFIGWAKNIIESHIEEDAQNRAAQKPATPVSTFAPPLVVPSSPEKVTERDLPKLVNDGFPYLSQPQREELLTRLEQALADPANSAYKDEILTQFADVARQASFTHRQLDRLSGSEKRALAQQFAANFQTLNSDQQQDLLQRLRARALPLPDDLNEMMLSALAPAG